MATYFRGKLWRGHRLLSPIFLNAVKLIISIHRPMFAFLDAVRHLPKFLDDPVQNCHLKMERN